MNSFNCNLICRFLYWSDWGEVPLIERALLDGSQRKAIVTHDLGFPNGLTIDFKGRRLYWTDALKQRIDTSDLNGQHRVQLVPHAKNPFGMTQVGNEEKEQTLILTKSAVLILIAYIYSTN